MNVTDQAGHVLLETIQANEVPSDQSLRLASEGDGLALLVDAPTENDKTFEHEDRTVLVVDQAVEELLGDVVVDVVEEEGETKLTIRPQEGG